MGPLASKTGVVKFVQKGDRGPMPPMPYPVGIYDHNELYECTKYVAPMVVQDGLYYVMNKVGTWKGSTVGRTPKDEYARYGEDGMWIYMEKYKAAFYEIFFANFAKLGSGIFYGDYLFSQYGVDSSGLSTDKYKNFNPNTIGQSNCPFTPNVLINWLNGSSFFRNCDVQGQIRANRLYTPFQTFPAGTHVWDLDVYTANITIDSGQEITKVTLPDIYKYSGLELRVMYTAYSRTSNRGYLVPFDNGYFRVGLVTHKYYKLPENQLTRLISIGTKLNGWTVVNPVMENFTDTIV